MKSSSRQLRSACYLAHATWFAFQIRLLSRHRDLEGTQTILACNSRRSFVQYVVDKISDLRHVRIRKTREEMIGKNLRATILVQESRGGLLHTSDQNRSGGSDNFSANIVAIGRLHERFDIANRTMPVFQVNHARNHVTV